VWACGRIGLNDAQLEELHRAVVKEWLANNRLPLSYDQVRLLAQKLLGNVTACGPRQPKGCPKCERLEAILSGNPALRRRTRVRRVRRLLGLHGRRPARATRTGVAHHRRRLVMGSKDQWNEALRAAQELRAGQA